METADAPSSSNSTQDSASLASKGTLHTRLSSAFQSIAAALHFRQSPVKAHYVLETEPRSRSELQLSLRAESRAPSRLVHASIIDLDEIEICKLATGEDWLLGMGSYGMVSWAAQFLQVPLHCVESVLNATACDCISAADQDTCMGCLALLMQLAKTQAAQKASIIASLECLHPIAHARLMNTIPE